MSKNLNLSLVWIFIGILQILASISFGYWLNIKIPKWIENREKKIKKKTPIELWLNANEHFKELIEEIKIPYISPEYLMREETYLSKFKGFNEKSEKK